MRYAWAFALLLLACSSAAQEKYDRRDWGRWSPTGERGANGCPWDHRHSLLLSVGSVTPETLVTCEERGKPCMVLNLTMVDVYTGESYTGPAIRVDIDHLVPLAEAHRSGGWRWPREKRLAFWNDPLNHVVTHERTNSRKGDLDPGGESQRGRRNGWWPPDPLLRCWYVSRWMAVKEKWGLTLDAAEVRALLSQDCPVVIQ